MAGCDAHLSHVLAATPVSDAVALPTTNAVGYTSSTAWHASEGEIAVLNGGGASCYDTLNDAFVGLNAGGTMATFAEQTMMNVLTTIGVALARDHGMTLADASARCSAVFGIPNEDMWTFDSLSTWLSALLPYEWQYAKRFTTDLMLTNLLQLQFGLVSITRLRVVADRVAASDAPLDLRNATTVAQLLASLGGTVASAQPIANSNNNIYNSIVAICVDYNTWADPWPLYATAVGTTTRAGAKAPPPDVAGNATALREWMLTRLKAVMNAAAGPVRL